MVLCYINNQACIRIEVLGMNETFDIQAYMTKGVENIVKNAIKATLTNPEESLFMARFAAATKKASKKRAEAEAQGEHVPAFLIASITSSCNLHCAGCYSRANHACEDSKPVDQLTTADWEEIFDEAEELGISFILLAGGEPMLRRDVIETAGKKQNILFPVFTNGTMIDDRYLDLLKHSRNLLPVISIEGREEKTDLRRGAGVYAKATAAMERMQKNKVLFGASVTVTTENLEEVMSDAFLTKLEERGCKAVFFVEFVPVTEEARHLAPGEVERDYMTRRLRTVREDHPEMVFVSFPGDEKSSGGCVAAGRGFFHVNSHGGAEPCPFSPYSDVNVRELSLRGALHSPLFQALQSTGALLEDHAGGCILFEKREEVERILKASAAT